VSDSDGPVNSGLADQGRALIGEVADLLNELQQNLGERKRLPELNQARQEEFEKRGGWAKMTPEEVPAFYEKTRPVQEEIDRIDRQHREAVARIEEFASRVRQHIVRCTIQGCAAETLLDQADQLHRDFVNRAVQPDVGLLKLRSILLECLQASSPLSSPSRFPMPSTEVTAQPGLEQQTVPGSRKRVRRPNLELSRRRVEQWEELSWELATIREQTNRYVTIDGLKTRYPRFKLWQILPESEQRELPNGDFNPKAFAGRLVLRQYGLTSLETLRKDRQKLQKRAAANEP
jgi:hypothetical protein